MNSNIFRKKSIDKVSSPEQLNEYIRVVTPASWIVLCAIFIMLIGTIVWGVLGTIETTIPAVAVCKDGKTICYVNTENLNTPYAGMKITIEGQTGYITSIKDTPIRLDSADQAYLLYKGGLEKEDFCYEIEAYVKDVCDGIYTATITVNSVSPIKFVLR